MEKKLFVDDNIGFVEILEVFGDDLTVANAARVSFHKESHMETVQDQEGNIVSQQLSDKDAKLVTFLAKHNHVTPFFHPMIRMRLKMPIPIAREWFRHVVGFARNEVSRRYVSDAPDFYTPKTLRKRDENVKQGSSKEPIDNNSEVLKEIEEYHQKALAFYNKLMDEDRVCPEQARFFLPQSMHTEFIETGSLSAYARLVKLRDEASAQKEIQDYAKCVSALIEPHFPVGWKALMAPKS